jgi:hypothetical protein
MKKNFLSIVFLITAYVANAQSRIPVWGQTAGGYGDDHGVSSVDASGNLYVAGSFESDTIFFHATAGDTMIESGFGPSGCLGPCVSDMFLTKLDFYGNVVWARSIGGSGFTDERATCIVTDPGGNIYVGGEFWGPSINIGSYTFNNSGVGSDAFLIKYDPLGNIIWAKVITGPDCESLADVAIDLSGNIIVSGRFRGSSAMVGPVTLTNAGGFFYDAFFAKYDPLGNTLFARSAGGNNKDDEGFGISADPMGNIIFTGYYGSSSIVFGSTTLVNSVTTGTLTKDVFIAKYDGSGNVLWAKKGGGRYDDFGQDVVTSSTGDIFLTGYFYSDTAHFGAFSFAGLDLSGGHSSAFLSKYDSSGNEVWAKRVAGYTSVSICMDHTEKILISGMTMTYASFASEYDQMGNYLWGVGQSSTGSGTYPGNVCAEYNRKYIYNR